MAESYAAQVTRVMSLAQAPDGMELLQVDCEAIRAVMVHYRDYQAVVDAALHMARIHELTVAEAVEAGQDLQEALAVVKALEQSDIATGQHQGDLSRS